MSNNTVRPAATDTDKAIFDQLLQKISAVDTYFCCGGTLELVDRPLALYYKSTDTNSWLDFCSLSKQPVIERQTVIDRFLQACVPAPHGRGDETVLDESYRLARELHQGEFALSIDVLTEVGSGILSSISALTAGRSVLSQVTPEDPNIKPDLSVPNLTMIPRLYKLNAYNKGGFFKSHRDTPKGNDHIGTLMIALPVTHDGGVLCVQHDGKEVLFNWGQQCSQGAEVSEDGQLKISLPWAFLFSDVEHEVLPVESGTRITIAYDIFSSKASMMNIGPPVSDLDGTATPLYKDLVQALHNPSFLSEGAQVAIALSHSYPMIRRNFELTNDEFAAGLKGVDAILYRALKAAGFVVSLRAVMTTKIDYDFDPKEFPDDGYDPTVCSNPHYPSGSEEILITSKFFAHADEKYVSVDVDAGDEYDEVVDEYFGAEPSPELMWVKKPKDTFIHAGSYVRYANQHTLDFFYAAATFVLDVPPFGQGSRVFS